MKNPIPEKTAQETPPGTKPEPPENGVVVKGETFHLLFNASRIARRIRGMAKQIEEECSSLRPLFLVVLNGAFIFAADLLRHIRIPCDISFIRVSSYHLKESTGEVKEIIGLSNNPDGRHVIIIDDIADTGVTLNHIAGLLRERGASTVQAAVLLHKPEAFRAGISPDYIGFHIENRFVIGYGLDYDGQGRNLDSIYVLSHTTA